MTDWPKFYEQLTAPTSEYYDRMAKMGSLFLLISQAELSGATRIREEAVSELADHVNHALTDYSDPEAITGMVAELVEAMRKATV